MLRLIIGQAGAGKTTLIMNEIARAVAQCRSGQVLLVPEQYSHEAERELARIAGDSMSLYAEALSFTGIARQIEAELGTGGKKALDKGGRLLCMALALDAVSTRLQLYSAARRSPEQQLGLLAALDELKAAGLTAQALDEAASELGGALEIKLSDLSLIMGAFDAAVGAGKQDPADRLGLVLERLPDSSFAREGHVYIDGFTDFTAQERELIASFMSRGADMTVCLTLDDLTDGSEVFELSRRTARWLLREAGEHGVETEVSELSAKLDDPISVFAANIFSYSSQSFDADGKIRLFRADTVTEECELAAAHALELVRGGARWRDIAVAVRSFEDYRNCLESAFEYWGVPLFTARKVDIMQKPLPALISAAYEILDGGWEIGDVFEYLRTGLAGICDEECDELENYCITWSVRASMWLSEKDWRLHPDGYGGKYDEAAIERLERINDLRRRVAAPLLRLDARSQAAQTATEQAATLSDFLEDLDLAEKLAERADELEARGRAQAADEYARLWDLTVSALEQTVLILGDAPMDTATFSRLFLLTLSQYDVGIIPVSLDMATAGDMDRMRRRHIKHLIVLGASDERLPRAEVEGGLFSTDERMSLAEAGIALDAGDAELWREYSLIYNCLSLPSETLTMVTPAWASDGKPARAAFVMSRAAKLFGLSVEYADPRLLRATAPAPALELAASHAVKPGDGLAAAAVEYFEKSDPGRLATLTSRAEFTRGSLSAESARTLYGDDLRLSASRIDRFSSCRFGYFLKYGLTAKPREPAEFSPPEFGSFMHYVLQHVAEEASEKGGFKKLSAAQLDVMTEKYVELYIKDELGGFEGRGARFEYLFRRLTQNVRRVVADMAEELKNSDFEPLDFELDFTRAGLSTETLPNGGKLSINGIADRVDGWVHDGRLYLRVIDYKTGKKSFSLSDVWHGMNLQMLIYLFALQQGGQALYGREIVPAGVLYIPARDVLLSASADMSDEEIASKRAAALRRSGLMLEDAEVLHAMEHGDEPLRIPVKWKNGVPTGESLASAERLGLLSGKIQDTLISLATEITRGSISADPYYKGAQDHACLYCEYADACRFTDGEGGDRRRYLPKLSATKIWNELEGGAQNG